MSSIFSTQNRHTFLRRKYCFFCVSTALSPPVGRCDALPGLPLDSAISKLLSSYQLSALSFQQNRFADRRPLIAESLFISVPPVGPTSATPQKAAPGQGPLWLS